MQSAVSLLSTTRIVTWALQGLGLFGVPVGASKRNEPVSLLSRSHLCIYSRQISLPLEYLAWLYYLSSISMDQSCSLASGGTSDVWQGVVLILTQIECCYSLENTSRIHRETVPHWP